MYYEIKMLILLTYNFHDAILQNHDMMAIDCRINISYYYLKGENHEPTTTKC